jgi:hypothetical protein
MKLDLNAKAEAVVAADEEATAEVMVVEAVAGAAVMAEAAVVAVGEGVVATAVVADAIVNSSQRVSSSTGANFFAPFFWTRCKSTRRLFVVSRMPFSSVFPLPRFFRPYIRNA